MKIFLTPILAIVFVFLNVQISFAQSNGAIDNMRSDTIDVLKYKLNMDLTQMSTQTFSAACQINYEVKMNGVEGISLDLLQLQVDSVKAVNTPLNFTYNDTLLRVDFPNILNQGDVDSITVYYGGSPQTDPSGFGGVYFSNDYVYNLGVAFQSEPHNYGRTWHPCFDNFKERAKYDIEITTPQGIKAYSNGYIESETVGANNENIRRWKLEEEIPTYLACFAAAPYTHVSQTYVSSLSNDQMPVMLISKPQDTTQLKNSFSNLFGAMEAYETRYGPYEWNKIAFVLVPFGGGAMEHASCVTYPKFAVDGSLNYETLMAHELSHHWWGNLVTCETAEDMWINEGLASFSESIFLEHVYDYDRYIQELKGVHRDVIQKAHHQDGGFLSISGVPHEATYGSHTYSKGATVMHNLRTHMGDADFFTGLNAIQSNYAFKTINAAEFRDELTASTAYNASNFFKNYIFNPGFNGFEIDSVKYDTQGSILEAKVYIEQKLFEAPEYFEEVPLEITFVDENWNSFSVTEIVTGQTAVVDILELPFVPQMVYLNKSSGLLNAVTGEDVVVEGPGSLQLNYAYFNMKVNAEEDSSFVRVEHYRLPPDGFNYSNGNHEFVISPDRYWKVDGLLSDSFQAEARLFYDARNSGGGNLDNGLMQDHAGIAFHEDSLVLLWRPAQNAAWEEYADYTLFDQGSPTDGYGRVEIQELVKGEYTFGFRKSNLSTTGEVLPKQFNVYPNPVSDQLNVAWENIKNVDVLKVFDVQGKLIAEKKLIGNQISISTNDFQKGVYHLAFFAGERVVEKQKFIKE